MLPDYYRRVRFLRRLRAQERWRLAASFSYPPRRGTPALPAPAVGSPCSLLPPVQIPGTVSAPFLHHFSRLFRNRTSIIKHLRKKLIQSFFHGPRRKPLGRSW